MSNFHRAWFPASSLSNGRPSRLPVPGGGDAAFREPVQGLDGEGFVGSERPAQNRTLTRWEPGCRINRVSKQHIKAFASIFDAPERAKETAMVWIAALVLMSAFIVLGLIFRNPVPEEGWREQADGLRERLERSPRG
jgi:hypothetical protein